MDQTATVPLSPHRIFSRADWAKLRADTPMTLTGDDLERLHSLNGAKDRLRLELIKRA